MTCKFCQPFWNWFSEKSDAWERRHSNEGYLAHESEQLRKLIEQASAIENTDPAAAFRLFVEAAEGGSPWSMVRVGWHYQTGTGVTADLHKALDYYHRAICAGSWMSTIFYARLLAREGRYENSFQVLKDGIESDFVPAYYWLARLRYERSRDRKVCREVRPLLECAASKGHPGARLTLARWMLLGKLGFREMFGGFVMTLRLISDFRKELRTA